MLTQNKIISIDTAISTVDSDIVLCYGHFNLIHPGHLRYLQYAKTLAEKLFVALVSDADLHKDSFGQHFSENERAESVANLQIIDGVIILNQITLKDLIDKVKPSALVLGKEFEKIRSNEINEAIEVVKKTGRVVYHAGEAHYFNANLLYSNVVDIEGSSKVQFQEICKKYKITANKLQEKIHQFSKSKLLVIGDTIVDNYVACDALGMSAEAPVLVVKELESREFIGGAAIVASHVKALGAECYYISVVGDDPQSEMVSESLKEQNIKIDLFTDKDRPTTYKTRYMVEGQKLFRVSRIKDYKIPTKIEQEIIDSLIKLAPSIDGIMISDFVYGVITQKILDEISNLSTQYGIKLYGDLQCSSQVGKVNKFKGFDLITPTEKEARVALDDNESGIEWIANTLLKDTNSKNILTKLGSDGFIAYKGGTSIESQNFPALTINPVDATGAGDSLFAAMSISLSSGSSLMEASAIGACMASLAVKQVGNNPISKEKLSIFIEEILS